VNTFLDLSTNISHFYGGQSSLLLRHDLILHHFGLHDVLITAFDRFTIIYLTQGGPLCYYPSHGYFFLPAMRFN
jgi:hypothetical protein